MTEKLHTARGLSLSMASLGTTRVGPASFTPNWIDYRASVRNVDRRADNGDTAETCAACGCETDVTPVPHSPTCKTLIAQKAAAKAAERVCVEEGCDELVASKHGKRCPTHADLREQSGRRRYNGSPANGSPVEGRDLLEQLDAGERVTPAKAPERDAKARVRWTRELALERIRELAAELGRPPTVADVLKARLSSLQTTQTVRRLGFESFTELRREALKVSSVPGTGEGDGAARDHPAVDVDGSRDPDESLRGPGPLKPPPVAAPDRLLPALIAASRAFLDTLERELGC